MKCSFDKLSAIGDAISLFSCCVFIVTYRGAWCCLRFEFCILLSFSGASFLHQLFAQSYAPGFLSARRRGRAWARLIRCNECEMILWILYIVYMSEDTRATGTHLLFYHIKFSGLQTTFLLSGRFLAVSLKTPLRPLIQRNGLKSVFDVCWTGNVLRFVNTVTVSKKCKTFSETAKHVHKTMVVRSFNAHSPFTSLFIARENTRNLTVCFTPRRQHSEGNFGLLLL